VHDRLVIRLGPDGTQSALRVMPCAPGAAIVARAMRDARVPGLLLGLAALGAAGCGGIDGSANRPRPPAEIDVTAAIADGAVRVSPRRFGAGPIVLLVSNQTGRPQRLTFETDDARPGIVRSTGAIPPAGTTTLEVEVRRGRYAVHTADRSVRPAAVRVGRERPSAQDRLLTP
jgi:hypothetical protein